MKKCKAELQLIGGFGEVKTCGKPAVFIAKTDRDGDYAVCEDCSLYVHPKRLRPIEVEDVETTTV